jgi:predicted dehydrogenase
VSGELRVGLIGFGLAGSVFHAPLVASTPGLALATIVTANPHRAARASAAHPGARVETSADALWERADEHDLVVVATPNDSHVALAMRAIEAGLAVVVDKPLAPSSADARELIGAAESGGTPLSVFHNRRWDSDQLTLRRLIADGSLGAVRRYESRFERWRPNAPGEGWRDATAPAEGGGVALDLLTHLVDQALVLFGPPAGVYGEVDRRRGGPADDDAFVAIEHEGGVRSHLWASAVAGEPGPRLRVLGERAAYVVDALDGQEQALLDGRRPDEAGDEWGVEPRDRWGRLVRGDESEAVAPERGDWPRFYSELAVAIRKGAPPPVDPRDALAALELLERAGLIEGRAG